MGGSISRPKITDSLNKALEKYLDPHNDPRIYWAKEVTFDYATEAPSEIHLEADTGESQSHPQEEAIYPA